MVTFGVDPIHFAAIMLLNLEIGMVTPITKGKSLWKGLL